MTCTFEGTITPANRARRPYLYLPVEVPVGITRIDVNYRYDEGNIVDIGIVDPHLRDFPSQTGFRGWSGGARSSFFVARDDATPGYIPGEIPPGVWQVMLGLYRIQECGCRYHVVVTLDATPRDLVPRPKSVPPARTECAWYRGDLHSHTHHSDALGSLQDLIQAASKRGLDFLAVTDHNTYSHHRHLAMASTPQLLLVPGQEITTDRGHANAWGVDGWVDFRALNNEDMMLIAEEVRSRGGVFSVNHPKTGGPQWSYPIPHVIDCMEAWQAPWPYYNWESLNMYDMLLRQGRRVTLVGGSDRHQPGWPDADPEILQVGSPTTWLYLQDLSVVSVLRALRQGQGFVSESPAGPRLEVRAGDVLMGSSVVAGDKRAVRGSVWGATGDALRWISDTGLIREVAIEGDEFHDEWTWVASGRYLRAEVVGRFTPEHQETARHLQSRGRLPAGLDVNRIHDLPLVRALSNPVYITAPPI